MSRIISVLLYLSVLRATVGRLVLHYSISLLLYCYTHIHTHALTHRCGRDKLKKHVWQKPTKFCKAIILQIKNRYIKKNILQCDSSYTIFWKKQNFGDSKKINCCQGLGRGADKQAEYRGFLKQWNYPSWYYDGGFMPPHMCLNPQAYHIKGKL